MADRNVKQSYRQRNKEEARGIDHLAVHLSHSKASIPASHIAKDLFKAFKQKCRTIADSDPVCYSLACTTIGLKLSAEDFDTEDLAALSRIDVARVREAEIEVFTEVENWRAIYLRRMLPYYCTQLSLPVIERKRSIELLHLVGFEEKPAFKHLPVPSVASAAVYIVTSYWKLNTSIPTPSADEIKAEVQQATNIVFDENCEAAISIIQHLYMSAFVRNRYNNLERLNNYWTIPDDAPGQMSVPQSEISRAEETFRHYLSITNAPPAAMTLARNLYTSYSSVRRFIDNGACMQDMSHIYLACAYIADEKCGASYTQHHVEMMFFIKKSMFLECLAEVRSVVPIVMAGRKEFCARAVHVFCLRLRLGSNARQRVMTVAQKLCNLYPERIFRASAAMAFVLLRKELALTSIERNRQLSSLTFSNLSNVRESIANLTAGEVRMLVGDR